MVVVYYTQTYFLDAALETICSIKNNVELHLLIEISPQSSSSTIINIEDLNKYNIIEQFDIVMGFKKAKKYKNYLEGLASVSFVIYKYNKSFTYQLVLDSYNIGKFIKNLNPDIIHFDTITFKSIALLPYLFNLKIFITVHDAMSHSGEESWKKKFTNYVYFKFAKGFFFYSFFSKNQFEATYPNLDTNKFKITFQPFTFLKQFALSKSYTPSAILFFGRLSSYKGIDLLFNAIPIVLKKYPNQIFVIAGKSENFLIDYSFLKKYENNIIFLNKYLTSTELVNLILHSKFIVCPYKDASQSGVLMTSFAFGKCALVTNVGAFPEYINHEINGFIAETNPESIANGIISLLHNNLYLQYQKNVISNFSHKISYQNNMSIINAYNDTLKKI